MNILIVFSLAYSLLNFLVGSFLPSSVLFESLESKNAKGGAVFNKIKLIQKENQDIWLMDQSHYGTNAHEWDEVKIIVDKRRKPYLASYHQLKNGVEIEYKVSCFRCHSSGPRLIRPKFNSQKVNLSFKEKILIFNLNLLIKSYGEVLLKENDPFIRKTKFVSNVLKSEDILKVKSCTRCHGDGKIRGSITKEQVFTAEFLLKEKEMPPWPYQITQDDQKKLSKWLYGF